MDLNKVMLIGRLTRDPEARSTPSGQSVCSFSVATSRNWTDQQGQKQEKTEFHNIVAWGKLADICSQYLNKGKQVYIEGRLQTRDWEGQDGVKRYRTEVIMDNMIMLGSKGSGGGAPSGPSTPIITEDVPTGKSDTDKGKKGGDDEINVEDIPF
ncbi:MAG: single-stranded DNA-binding protein [Candidatus Buchananbacteria bacterium CG10_big_fil_rev_8_21_14_0_10_42_9]|uniref:Single-stranded DNA-binding protein n=1 Tax=Candidatus Buchananbacteria bacterium CG10_big_fil_rev_8_21_14_0_10_42_9 TaxID=1974526 RepID=A0A2H0W1E5_9BACT|nr:MAG: single-stranded DNA-binding protein [Candidatus Buchananbacteria bacterium CG10_big_fil_rev_8_21_14_0_10_42_9]